MSQTVESSGTICIHAGQGDSMRALFSHYNVNLGRCMVLEWTSLDARCDILDRMGGTVGPAAAAPALPLVLLLVLAPELHPCAVQHAPLPGRGLPGALFVQSSLQWPAASVLWPHSASHLFM